MPTMMQASEALAQYQQTAPIAERYCANNEMYAELLKTFEQKNPGFPEQFPRQWWALQEMEPEDRFHYVYELLSTGHLDSETINTLWVKASQIEQIYPPVR